MHDAHVASLVLARLMRGRCLLPGAPQEPTDAARALHLARITSFVEAREAIALVLPAFPAKAPNRAKVLGTLPDAAERAGLEALSELVGDIAAVHPPGATLVICSDGHVFADAVGVPDEAVVAYRRHLRAMIDDVAGPNIRLFDLTDAYGEARPVEARRMLLDAHAPSVDEIRARAAACPSARAQLDGIHRFLFEDETVRSLLSRSQVRRLTRARAYEVVRRSEAWGRLVAARFPRAIRLSVHPQPDVSAKIGIVLVPASDRWLTPWHAVLVVDGTRARLMRRHEAEGLGAVVVEKNGRPHHMEIRA